MLSPCADIYLCYTGSVSNELLEQTRGEINDAWSNTIEQQIGAIRQQCVDGELTREDIESALAAAQAIGRDAFGDADPMRNDLIDIFQSVLDQHFG